MNYRTDLAVEADELLEDAERADETRSGAELSARRAAGSIKKQRQLDEDIAVIEIEILNEEGEKAFQRPRGTYVTIEIQGLFEEKENIRERASRAVAAELKKLIPFDYFLKVLVVGLGNEKVTPDSLGPHTVDKVKITRHLFQMFDCDGDWEMANVSGFNPSVTGVTGMETADLIAEVVSMVKPDVVLVIDALAAKNIRRVSTTIQISDSGIAPGAGMGNRRREISETTLGCRVIAIGVPTVIDARTLILDAAKASEAEAEQAGIAQAPRCENLAADENRTHAEAAHADFLERYLADEAFDMIVTSTDIDAVIQSFSQILANAINITLHPGIYS